MSFGHYLIAKEQEILLEVGMDDIALIRFFEGNNNMCLAAKNLNVGSVVLAVSQSAALLAHIAPLPLSYPDHPDAYYHHVEAKIGSFCAKYHQNQHLFPQNKIWIGTAIWGREVRLPHQAAFMDSQLRAAGLDPSKFHFQMTPTTYSTPAEECLVFVDGRPGRRGQPPSVYCGYRLITGTQLSAPEGEKLDGFTLVRAERATEQRSTGYRVQLNGQTTFVRDPNWEAKRVLDLITLRVSPYYRWMIMPVDW